MAPLSQSSNAVDLEDFAGNEMTFQIEMVMNSIPAAERLICLLSLQKRTFRSMGQVVC